MKAPRPAFEPSDDMPVHTLCTECPYYGPSAHHINRAVVIARPFLGLIMDVRFEYCPFCGSKLKEVKLEERDND